MCTVYSLKGCVQCIKKNTVNYVHVDVFWKLKLNEFKFSKHKSSNLCSAI